ncbi:hypothetical protein [Trichocoleus sp. FACHB-591]|uniref:hypothetical protein n=1 Tax=Trichocoleus sp. FACHB-591 TaxID=2692872 RepID=UPI0016865093|nr:hypothetical protein [Trichocoleus sp. FACHB-591]
MNVPISVQTGDVSISGNLATYQTPYGSIKFDTSKNPVKILDGELRQGLMQSIDGEWFLETNSGGINLLFVRLFHQTYLMKLPPGHQFIPKDASHHK